MTTTEKLTERAAKRTSLMYELMAVTEQEYLATYLWQDSMKKLLRQERDRAGR